MYVNGCVLCLHVLILKGYECQNLCFNITCRYQHKYMYRNWNDVYSFIQRKIYLITEV